MQKIWCGRPVALEGAFVVQVDTVANSVDSPKMRAQRTEIERLRTQVGAGLAGAAQLQAALTAAEETYVADLAARDRAYAQEIALFRAAVQNIAATPEGAAALARFNAGDETGALAILDDLRRARDAARKKRADIESAAEGRRTASKPPPCRAPQPKRLCSTARFQHPRWLSPTMKGLARIVRYASVLAWRVEHHRRIGR